MRCPLLIPPDGAALAAALASGADALILDLGEDAGRDGRAAARAGALAVLSAARAALRPPRLVVRIAGLATGLADGDLDAVMAGAPDAVLLPAAAGAADVQRLGAKLAVREAERGLPAGSTGILPSPADTARGVLALAGLPGAGPRLVGLAWDARAFAAALGLADPRAEPCRAARALVLVAASASGVPAIDGPCHGDAAALARDCAEARRDGFSGKMAADPGQVEAIGAAFPARRPRGATARGP